MLLDAPLLFPSHKDDPLQHVKLSSMPIHIVGQCNDMER
jgi:hypothetical protein